MIARIHFKSTVTHKGKKLSMRDYVEIQVATLAEGEKVFKHWLAQGNCFKGSKNNVFHLQGMYGEIEFVKVEKRPEE